MLWTPPKFRERYQSNLAGAANTVPGTQVTTGAAAGTKGTPAQLTAATLFDVYWITIVAINYAASAVASQGSMDICAGAAAAEFPIIENLLFGNAGGSDNTTDRTGPKIWGFPLFIKAGTRLSCRAAGARVSTAFQVAMFLYGGHGEPTYPVASSITTYGASTPPNGTVITEGVSGVEAASWTQITASTTRRHFGIVPSYQISGDTTMNRSNKFVDIALGSAGSERFLGDFFFGQNAIESMWGPAAPGPLFTEIPAGTRLAMRSSSSNAADTSPHGALHCLNP